VAILDVTRVDTINDPARELLAGMSTMLSSAGKRGLLVDPDAAVIVPGLGFDDVVFGTLDEAVSVAKEWLHGSPG
jgi:glutaminase